MSFHECVTWLKWHVTSTLKGEYHRLKQRCVCGSARRSASVHITTSCSLPRKKKSDTSFCSSGWQISCAWVSSGHNLRAHTITELWKTNDTAHWHKSPKPWIILLQTNCRSSKGKSPQLSNQFTSTSCAIKDLQEWWRQRHHAQRALTFYPLTAT